MTAPDDKSKSRPDGGVPLGNGSDDEPANTLPAEPSNSTSGGGTATPRGDGLEQAHEDSGTDSEEDIPSDGRDTKGEEMISNLKS